MAAPREQRLPNLPWPGALYTDDARVVGSVLRRGRSGYDPACHSIQTDDLTQFAKEGWGLAATLDFPPNGCG